MIFLFKKNSRFIKIMKFKNILSFKNANIKNAFDFIIQ